MAAPVPAWARASGRAGQGDPLFAAGASLALLDAVLRRDPPAAGALRARLALQSAAASAKILRLNADEGALRDLRFAVGEELGPAAKRPRLWRELAGRPPSLDPGRLATAAALLDLRAPHADALAESLQDRVRGGEDPVSGAAKAAASAFSVFPDAPAAAPEIFAHWVFDMVIAIRLRWPRPVPLIATRILDPGLRSDQGGRSRPGEPGWEKTAAGAIALAAAAALDLAANPVPPRGHPARGGAQTAGQAGGKNRRPAVGRGLRLARRGGAPGADDRPRRASAVRPAGALKRRARAHGGPAFRLYGL